MAIKRTYMSVAATCSYLDMPVKWRLKSPSNTSDEVESCKTRAKSANGIPGGVHTPATVQLSIRIVIRLSEIKNCVLSLLRPQFLADWPAYSDGQRMRPSSMIW